MKMEFWKFFAKLLGKWYTFFIAITANILGFLSGMTIFWSSPVLAKLNGTDDNPFGEPITSEQHDWIGSVYSIGGAIGPILFIYAIDFLGRKYTLTIVAAIFPISYGILMFAKNITLYYISRALVGVGVSGTFSIVAVYLSEIVTSEMRGTYVSLGTTFILTGGLVSYCIGPYTPLIFYHTFLTVLSFFYLPLYFFSCPESLYFTMQKYGIEETREILVELRKNDEGYDIDNELELIRETVESNKRGNIFDVFKEKAGLKAFMICTLLLIFQQFIGITVVITYTQEIFADANMTIAPEVCSIIMSAVQTVTCFFTPVLMRRFNRKTLLIISFSGISLANLMLGCYFKFDFFDDFNILPLFALLFFVVSYTLGAGPIPWVFMGELYPHDVKSWGTALSNTIYWIVQFLLTYFFDKIDRGIAFIGFSVIGIVTVIYVIAFVIETKGKTLQEIQRSLS